MSSKSDINKKNAKPYGHLTLTDVYNIKNNAKDIVPLKLSFDEYDEYEYGINGHGGCIPS